MRLLAQRGDRRTLNNPINRISRHHKPSSSRHRQRSSGWCSRQSFLILVLGFFIAYCLLYIPTKGNQLSKIPAPINVVVPVKKKQRGEYPTALSNIKKTEGPHATAPYRNKDPKQAPAIDQGMQRSVLRSEPMQRTATPNSEEVSRSNDIRVDDDENPTEPQEDDDTKEEVDDITKKPEEEYSSLAVQQRVKEGRGALAMQSIWTVTTPYVMKTEVLPDHRRKKILVTGGAGFVGSHLVDKLMIEGHEVIVLDNFFTGQRKNIEQWLSHPNFRLVTGDVTETIYLEVDQIYHLACPASPPHYQYNPVKTIKTSTMGTINMLGLAKRVKARMLLTSTSEIYGDPEVHPQPETYWGNVNTIGPRSCYDEGKRVAETMMHSYKVQNNVEVRIARIFNTFGPRMHPNDGRVVSNFIIQSLQGKDMTIYGTGEQTRSFQYVSDLVAGLHKLMNSDYDLPVNLGNPQEFSMNEFAAHIQEITESKSQIIHLEKNKDDPSQRRPDITVAKEKINWEPKVKVDEGLKLTIQYFQRVLDKAGEIIPTGQFATKPEA